MAKGQRSNSPKRSRRGGRRSPKKSKVGVQKKISKDESEPAQLHEPKAVEEPDCECDLEIEAEGLQELPKMAVEAPVADVETIKADLIKFFWESLEENTHADLKSLSLRDEQLFFFGTVCAELAKSGKLTSEVESNVAMVLTADEAWIRSFLAGELAPAKAEEPEEPEAPVEQMETVEAEPVTEAADMELEEPSKPAEVEVAAEVAAEAPEAEVVEPIEVAVEEKPEDFAIMEDVVEAAPVEVPDPMEELVSELNTENTANVIADAVKTVSSKLGEQSADVAAPLVGLVPQDLNVVQSLDLA
jgi:hypothetical protein